MTPEVEQLLALNSAGIDCIQTQGDGKGAPSKPSLAALRPKKYLAVGYKAPQNSAVLLFDYKNKKSRIVFGPELIMLEPYEEFTMITLSGGTPKLEGQIKTL